MKTILITGIRGFLGRNLYATFKDKYNILGLEKIPGTEYIVDQGLKIYSSDCNFKRIFEENRIFAIIHCATIYRKKSFSTEIIESNVLLPVKLYELALEYQVILFINTDSFFNSKKYNYSYLKEYTLSKRNAEDWLKILVGKTKIFNLKIFHMYGPGDSKNKFFNNILNQLKNNVNEINLTKGEQERDFIYIKDVVSVYLLLLENYKKLNNNFIQIEVGTGITKSIKECVLLMKSITKSNSILNFGKLNYRENEIMHAKADISELINLGWNPSYNLEKGLIEMLKNE